jgi:CBS domain-containing protein
MSKPVITISINEKVRAAAELMVDKNVSLLGIISNDNRKNMLGILSETEIARVTLAFKSKTQRSVSEYIGMIFSSPYKKNIDAFSEPSLVTIGDIFTPNPTLIESGADLAEAAMILTRNNNVSGLPVVESLQDETKRDQPIGIISKSDIMRALAKIE